MAGTMMGTVWARGALVSAAALALGACETLNLALMEPSEPAAPAAVAEPAAPDAKPAMSEADAAAKAAKFEADRAAILAMTGDYDVTFHFEEVLALAPGYELTPEKDSGGQETVFVVEDTGDAIRLQHVLVVGPETAPIVVKHWRQDWVFEPTRIVEYAGLERWKARDVSAKERKGAWLQTVYQVDDSPRYAAIAQWTHDKNGISTWEPPFAYRPLPRREATTRDDYQVVNAVNRHTIAPWGWAHEQDNEKVVLNADGSFERVIAREVGINTYRKTDAFPMEPVTAYWEQTKDFWAAVREVWDVIEAEAGAFHVDGKEPGNPLYFPILATVEALVEGDITTAQAVGEFEETIAERVTLDDAMPAYGDAVAEAEAQATDAEDAA